MNKTDRAVMANVAKTGFTFATDSLFRTVRQGKASITRLVNKGWLTAHTDAHGTSYRMTDDGRDAVTYPVQHGLAR